MILCKRCNARQPHADVKPCYYCGGACERRAEFKSEHMGEFRPGCEACARASERLPGAICNEHSRSARMKTMIEGVPVGKCQACCRLFFNPDGDRDTCNDCIKKLKDMGLSEWFDVGARHGSEQIDDPDVKRIASTMPWPHPKGPFTREGT